MMIFQGNLKIQLVNMRVIKIFIGFFCLVNFFLPTKADDLTQDSTGIFSQVYFYTKNQVFENTNIQTAGVLGISPDLLSSYQKNGILKIGNENIANVCKSSVNEVLSTEDFISCQKKIFEMIQREKQFAKIEIIETEKVKNFSKFFDGFNNAAFDINTDIRKIMYLFFEEDSVFVSFPQSSAARQNLFSGIENSFRLGEDGSSGHVLEISEPCDENETSLFGGIVCVPKFCEDYVCLTINVTPGQRPFTFDNYSAKSTFANIIYALAEIGKNLKDRSGKLTPSRNTNVSYLFSQVFTFNQNFSFGNIFVPRTPPIFVGTSFSGENGFSKNSKKAEILGEKANDIKTTETPKQKMKNDKIEEIANCFVEIEKKVAYFCDRQIGDGSKTCGSKYLLPQENSLLYFTFSKGNEDLSDTFKNIFEDLEKARDSIKNLDNLEQIFTIRQKFFDEIPVILKQLWGQISEFQKMLSLINIEEIKKAAQGCDKKSPSLIPDFDNILKELFL